MGGKGSRYCKARDSRSFWNRTLVVTRDFLAMSEKRKRSKEEHFHEVADSGRDEKKKSRRAQPVAGTHMASIKWARAKAKTQKMEKDDIWVDFEQGRITKRERDEKLADIPCNAQPVTVSRSREPTSGQQSRRKADRGDSLTVVKEPLWGPSDDSEGDYGRSFCSYKDCSWQCATPSSIAERSKELKNVRKPPAAPAPDQLHPEPKSKRMPRPPDAPQPAHLPPDQLHPQPETKNMMPRPPEAPPPARLPPGPDAGGAGRAGPVGVRRGNRRSSSDQREMNSEVPAAHNCRTMDDAKTTAAATSYWHRTAPSSTAECSAGLENVPKPPAAPAPLEAAAAHDEPRAKKSKTNDSSVVAAAADEPLVKNARASESSVAAAVRRRKRKAKGGPTSLEAASGAHATSPFESGGAGADFTTPMKTHRTVAASADPKANGTQDGVGASSGVPKKATAGRLDTITKDSHPRPPRQSRRRSMLSLLSPPQPLPSSCVIPNWDVPVNNYYYYYYLYIIINNY